MKDKIIKNLTIALKSRIMKKIKCIRCLIIIIISSSFSQKNCAQYFMDPYSFGLQLQLQQQQQQIMQQFNQQMNDYYYKITPHFMYLTKDGKALTIEVQLSRTTPFSNVECSIKHNADSESKKLDFRTFAGDVIVPVGGSDWVIQCGDVLTVFYDNGKNWSCAFGKDYTPEDWSRFCQSQLNEAIEEYNSRNQVVVSQPSQQFSSPVAPNQLFNSGNQTSNRQRALEIDAQITQLQGKLAEAQGSLELYKGWDDDHPGVSTFQLVQAARTLINTYNQQIYNLQMEKANLGY